MFSVVKLRGGFWRASVSTLADTFTLDKTMKEPWRGFQLVASLGVWENLNPTSVNDEALTGFMSQSVVYTLFYYAWHIEKIPNKQDL